MSRKMEYVRVGNSGLKVSKVILGCMTYGDPNWQPWILPLDKALPILKHLYDSGINTYDVADTYSNGRSEEILGAFLKKYEIKRSSVVIMSKVFHRVDEALGPVDPVAQQTNDGVFVNQVGLSRKHIMDAVDASIARLGTYIDVLQIHRLDRDTPMEEIMKGLNDVIEMGKARYLGASSMAAWEFQMMQTVAEKHSWHKFISMQGFYNFLYREGEREMNAFCKATGVGLFPWSPLAAGVLTHPWDDRTDPREQTDVFLKLLFRGKDVASDKEIVSRVQKLAEKKVLSMAQVAIGWVFSKGGIMPICGLYNREQIDQVVEGSKIILTEEECKYLEEPYLPKMVMGF